MASSGTSAVRIIDSDNEVVQVTSNALDVNIAGGATIDIGDVDMFLDGGTAVLGGAGAVAAGVLRVTLASDDTHFGEVGSASDPNGNIHGQLRYIAEAHTHPGTQWTTQEGVLAGAVRNDTLEALFAVADGDITHIQVNAKGGLYVTGSEVENAAVQSEPLLIGGRYDSSARTLGDGDAGAVALNASGHVIMDVVDGGQLDTIIDTLETTLTAIETDQAAIEALLITIDSDTDAIKTAVQILDDWDDSNYANVNLNLAGSDAPTGGGAESGALRVTLANDSTGVISIDDGGNTITVDGTVSVNSHAVTNAGTFAVQVDGDALTSLQLLDDAIYVDDADWTDNTSKHVLVGGVNTSNVVTSGDVGPLRLNSVGSLIIDVENGGTLEGQVDQIETYLSEIEGATETIEAAIRYEDSGHTGGTLGIHTLTVRNDVLGDTVTDINNDYASFKSDTKGALYTTHGMTGLASDDNDTVGTSAEKISGADGDVACKRVDIMAHPSNTGYIWIGDSAVTTNGSNGGIRLAPGDFYSMDIDNTGDVYAVATVDGENVCFNYFT